MIPVFRCCDWGGQRYGRIKATCELDQVESPGGQCRLFYSEANRCCLLGLGTLGLRETVGTACEKDGENFV